MGFKILLSVGDGSPESMERIHSESSQSKIPMMKVKLNLLIQVASFLLTLTLSSQTSTMIAGTITLTGDGLK